jgi:hypothetical protein
MLQKKMYIIKYTIKQRYKGVIYQCMYHVYTSVPLNILNTLNEYILWCIMYIPWYIATVYTITKMAYTVMVLRIYLNSSGI